MERTIKIKIMKHFINVFVVLVLVGLAISVAYMSHISRGANAWGACYIPLTIFMGFWGKKLYNDY